MKPFRNEESLDHPLAGIGIARSLVRGGEADAVGVGELKEDGKRDGSIDGSEQDGFAFLRFQGDLEDLDFRDATAGGKHQGFRGELMFPDDLADAGDEEFLHGPARLGVCVDLALGEHAVEQGLGRVGEHFYMDCCSLLPLLASQPVAESV